MRTTIVGLFLSLAWSAVCSAQGTTLTWNVDGIRREAVVLAPARPTTSVPLVLAFHGAGDTAENFAGVGLHAAWPQAVTVYVQGLRRQAGGGGTFQTTDATSANRDLRLVDVLLPDLERRYGIDRRRVFATGFSNGAKFVYLLWATRASAFAAFAPVAGMLTAPVALDGARPVLHIAGQQDRQNDYQEQLKSIGLARMANRAEVGRACGRDCTAYSGSVGADSVVTLLHSGGHIWPNDATTRIAAFFKGASSKPAVGSGQ